MTVVYVTSKSAFIYTYCMRGGGEGGGGEGGCRNKARRDCESFIVLPGSHFIPSPHMRDAKYDETLADVRDSLSSTNDIKQCIFIYIVKWWAEKRDAAGRSHANANSDSELVHANVTSREFYTFSIVKFRSECSHKLYTISRKLCYSILCYRVRIY